MTFVFCKNCNKTYFVNPLCENNDCIWCKIENLCTSIETLRNNVEKLETSTENLKIRIKNSEYRSDKFLVDIRTLFLIAENQNTFSKNQSGNPDIDMRNYNKRKRRIKFK